MVGMRPTPPRLSGARPLWVDVITLFPGIFDGFLREGLIGRAIERGQLRVSVVPLRGFGMGRQRQVDDTPYGGGAGMVLRLEPLLAAVRSRVLHHERQGRGVWVLLLTPSAPQLVSATVEAILARCGVDMFADLAPDPSADLSGAVSTTPAERPPRALLILCGRYEGVDARLERFVDVSVALGQVVCMGGEAPAMMLIEALVRRIPGVLGNAASLQEESFGAGVIEGGPEYPQYTRPPRYQGLEVPRVLRSGDAAAIRRWRARHSGRGRAWGSGPGE